MTERPFYSDYMTKHRPKPPKSICKNVLLRQLGIASPSLRLIVAAGGKGGKAAHELDEYEIKMMRYLCYKRKLRKSGWKFLYRECRKADK